MIYARLRIQTLGPGYMHLPDWMDDEYVEQLTAEKVVRHFPRGRPSYREWVKTRGRNEALDLEVYRLAALRIRFGLQPGKAFAAVVARLGTPELAGKAPIVQGPQSTTASSSRSTPGGRPSRPRWLRSWQK